MKDILRQFIRESLKDTSKNIFDQVNMSIFNYTNEPVHSIQEAKAKRTTKSKGDLWEAFCQLWLEKDYEHVWLLKEVPDEVLELLQLKKFDMGIDLIVKDSKGNYGAVQCKYKCPYAKGTVPGTLKLKRDKVNWNELCTFLVLCGRSGPYSQHIVMTNGVGVRRVGRRQKKDVSHCLKTFQNTSLEKWYSMAGMEGEVLEPCEKNKVLTMEELRNQRLSVLENK